MDKLCSFKLLPVSDYLDLDWAPTPILRACQLGQVSSPILTALQRAFTGDEEINPAYRDHKHGVWEHPVTALEPDAVADVARLLNDVNPEAALATVPLDDPSTLADMGMPFGGYPRPYLRDHLAAVRAFYLHAAQRRLAVALWWD